MDDPRKKPSDDEAVTTPLFGERPSSTTDSIKTTPYSTTPLKEASSAPAQQTDTELRRVLAQRYDILGELGRGGMGVVYRARDRETGDVVALKVLQPHIAADPEIIERFKSELLLARKITHKNVCRVHDLARIGDVAAISMEFVEGESLRTILKRPGGVSLRRGLEWARQICSGLGEAHAQGVVHRDLKPENIMIARDGTLKVMDFGIARSLEPAATHKTSGAIIGTPAYMSPEQALGKPADHRSDIYSLGLILYEMFAGVPAFSGNTPVAVALKQVRETPPRPRQIEPAVPTYIEETILKCLEKEPSARFQSTTEIQTALSGTAVQGIATTPAAAEGRRRASWRKVRHVVAHRLPLVAVAVVISAIILGVGWYYFSAKSALERVRRAKAAEGKVLTRNYKPLKPNLDYQLEHTLRGPGSAVYRPVSSVAFSPDGSTLASGNEDSHFAAGRADTIKLWEVSTGRLLRTLPGRFDVSSVAFSPDGKLLASACYTGTKTIKLWDPQSGLLLRTLTGHTNLIWSVAFSPDGKLLASGSNDGTIKLWDPQSGLLLRTLTGYSWSVTFSPDGKLLASGSHDGTIKLWDPQSGHLLRTLEGHSELVHSVAFSPDGKLLASGSHDETIKLWDPQSGHLLRTLEGHSELVYSVAFSPDGKLLASGSHDETIKLWDPRSGHLLRTLGGHSELVSSVAFSPDGKLLASGSSDMTIKLWRRVEE